MAQPAYIITPYYYVNPAVANVSAILSDLDTILAANGWTVTAPGGPYRTPTDPWGRWFRLTFATPSATRLQVTMTDDQARVTTQREMDISGTNLIRYYYSPQYLYIENGTQTDYIYATLLSLAPESETVHNCYTIMATSRNNGSSVDSYTCGSYQSVRKDTNTYNTQGSPTTNMFFNYGSYAGSNYAVCSVHFSGARRWFPAWSIGQDTAGNYGLRGRLYNILLCLAGWVSIGTEYTIPIDNSTTGVFRVLNIPNNANNQYYMAVRKA